MEQSFVRDNHTRSSDTNSPIGCPPSNDFYRRIKNAVSNTMNRPIFTFLLASLALQLCTILLLCMLFFLYSFYLFTLFAFLESSALLTLLQLRERFVFYVIYRARWK